MYLFTEDGFISLRQSPKSPNLLELRVRRREHAEAVYERLPDYDADNLGLIETPEGDYPFRVVVPRVDGIEYVAELAERVDYENCKGELSKEGGVGYGSVLWDAWQAGERLEPKGEGYEFKVDRDPGDYTPEATQANTAHFDPGADVGVGVDTAPHEEGDGDA